MQKRIKKQRNRLSTVAGGLDAAQHAMMGAREASVVAKASQRNVGTVRLDHIPATGHSVWGPDHQEKEGEALGTKDVVKASEIDVVKASEMDVVKASEMDVVKASETPPEAEEAQESQL